MNFKPDYDRPSVETRMALLSYLNSSLQGTEGLKDNLLRVFYAKMKILISEFNEKYNEISNIRLQYLDLIKRIIGVHVIDPNSANFVDEILSLPTERALESLFRVPFINHGIELGLNPPVSQSQIVTFLNNTKTLTKINIAEKKAISIDLKLQNAVSDHIIMCDLPENKIFCYGNWEPVGTTFIIDAEYSIIELDDGKPCCSTFATLLDDSIYVFGGWKAKGELSSLVAKFSLITSEWKDLAPLPRPSSSVYSLAIGNRIWLSGFNHQKLYCYDEEKNKYLEYIDLTKDCSKIMFKDELASIYIIESGGKIVKGEPGGVDWQIVGLALHFNEIISQCKLYVDSIYFLDYDRVLYEFNLSQMNINMINQFI